MKIFSQILLCILVIPVVLIGVMSFTLKFRLLDPQFWETTYEKYNVYSDLTTVLKKTVIDQTLNDGGRASDANSITDLLTQSNVKIFFNRNLENILNYINGINGNLYVYIPTNLVPKGLLPAKFADLSETMTATTLIDKLNIQGVTQTQIQSLHDSGIYLNYLVTIDVIIILIILSGFYFLTEKGSRFIAPGIASVFVGLFFGVIYFFGNRFVRNTIPSLMGVSPAEKLLGTLTPPIFLEILGSWALVGIAATILGVILIIIKRPELNS